MWNDRYRLTDPSLAGVAFDPGTMMVASAGASLIGAGVSAAGSIASGNAAAQAGQMQQSADYAQAQQLDENATQAFASGQRQALDTANKARLALSTARARGGASGVDVSTGSPANVQGELAKRGSYQALMDMFNGESTATGLHNQAAAARYGGDVAAIEGEDKQEASRYSAAATLASGFGSAASTYGKFYYPTATGRAGAGL